MIDFGYKITSSNTIDLDKQTSCLYKELVVKEQSVKLCIGCGTCSAICSASDFTDVSPRRIFNLLLRKQEKLAKEMAEKCMLCGKCQMMCIRGVNLRNALKIIKESY